MSHQLAEVLQTILSLAIAAMLWLRGVVLKGLLEDIGEWFFGYELLHAAAACVKSVACGIVGTALIQTLLVALSQIGILLVVIWDGTAWCLFSNSSDGWAFFMIVWGLFVSCIDNVIRPLWWASERQCP
jgi:hypothetical protein